MKKILRGTPAGRPMNIVTDENGRTKAVVDFKKIEAIKPVCARGKTKQKFSRNPRPKGG